ncbi:MAG: acyltransferase [Candidatus Amulumruptor caecigallinarius]|nr:acyltransferase [Candidatus Amulumruptor caecigallinarius]MCM1397148.1 acyltransferase [Candidatus Amulumruptor caecigallinarius]MCM1453163.1 acyltransferase [bacterium]
MTNADTNIAGRVEPARQRDTQLDIYRALVMIYILCVIHTAYWMSLLGEPWKSVLLIEMPVIFFISGASLSVTKKQRSFMSHVGNRLKRVWLPYIIYIVLLILLAWAAGWQAHDVWKYNVSWTAIINQLTLVESKSLAVPYNWHLWFVVPYIVIALLFWVEQKIADRISRWWMIAGALAVWGVGLLLHLSFVNQITGYNVFFVAGYLFYRQCSLRTVIGILIVSLSVIAVYCIWLGDFTPMQTHKFGIASPDLLFMAYGTMALCVLSLLLWHVRIPGGRLINRWNVYGYTIYLWQNVIFWIVYVVMVKVCVEFFESGSRWRMIVVGILIFIFSTLLSFVTVPVERWLTVLVSAPFRRRSKSA